MHEPWDTIVSQLLAAAREQALEHETLLAERDELRARVRELAGAASAAARTAQVRPLEPNQAEIRELLRPAELLAELGWDGPESDLALPIPQNVITEGARYEWDWAPSEQAATSGPSSGQNAPRASPEPAAPPAIAYLLPGLPPEGSGGSHSLAQEARGIRALGAKVRICVPADALATAQRLYGNDDELFVAYDSEEQIVAAAGCAAVVVSSEYTSVPLAARVAAQRPEVVCMYYVQDYEPLFAPVASARADRALLSYREIPGQILFAKTHWLRNVVMARHGMPVMKVKPSLDGALFHARGRVERERPLRVAAMVRPRTPRRRALATLATLQTIARTLGDDVQALAFGCDAGAFEEVLGTLGGGEASVAHLGLLSRAEVAEVMRRSDVFVDASAYQAFGRTGFEAMACGAVPVLPALGGVREYAAHDANALILEQDSPAAIAAAVCELLCDPERLRRLRREGLRTAAKFSLEAAARSQLGLFAAVTTARTQPATVAA